MALVGSGLDRVGHKRLKMPTPNPWLKGWVQFGFAGHSAIICVDQVQIMLVG